MSRVLNGNLGSLAYSAAILSLAAAAFFFNCHNESVQASSSGPSRNGAQSLTTTTFPANAGTLGALPDHVAGCNATGATPRNVTFTVTGMTGAVTDVQPNMTFGSPVHSWVGDIEAVLIAPNGASHTVFGRTLETTATGCGDSTDAAGPYTFADSAAAPPNGGWWQTANILGAAVPMTSGTYRTTNIGGAGATIPMPPTTMNTSFAGVTDANGTWTLRLSDHGGGDTGAVSAANLTLTTGGGPPADANVDMDGDGKTDFAVARATTSPLTEATAPGQGTILNSAVAMGESRQRKVTRTQPADNAITPPIFWYMSNGSGGANIAQWGDAATDFITPEDFDGDGKDDLTVWRGGPPNSAEFLIFQSATATVRIELFGQDGDDPAVVGDYDGDGKADPAVYRCPSVTDPAGQCFFYFRGSSANPSGNVTFVPWGFGNDGDFFPSVGDYDGDGKNDFCIQRSNPAVVGQGQFVLLRSSDFGTEFVNWGNDSDFILPGDYDGDGKSDFMVRRTVGSTRQNWLLTRTGATSMTIWGITGDVSAPGDYDGDGKQDLAIWRPNADPNQNYFWILNSGTGSVTQFEWGQCPTGSCDFAIASWAVH
ncbi:MAG TPA: FG-GAP and VCBS repeat-containing protein [Pyrinomonadaceae bacterium]|nr:FG-GAP and VCBS repeat-containing protein [Pyrinomonadaceae bacterium]